MSISQKGFERILLIEFSDKEYGDLVLIYEMLKPGNLILCKKDEGKLIVLNPLVRRQFKDRQTKAREEYEFPPAQPDIIKLNEKEIAEILVKSDKDPVKAIAIELGLGGIYAEELLERANLRNIKKINEDNAKTISKELKKLLDEKLNSFISGNEAFPIKMKTKPFEKESDSFQKAIDTTIAMPKIEQKIESKAVLKMKSIVESQNKRTRELKKEAEENQKIGEYIYEHYSDFEKLLSMIKEMRKTKSLSQIKEELKKNKHFKEMNEKEKKIIFEF
jgi:predicted ribosome quality control (RQC) complex YloA/Tae2 family protein